MKRGAGLKRRAIIFDLDGTLLDTLQDLGESMNAVLYEYNFPVHPVRDYRFFVGKGMDALVQRVLPEEEKGNKVLVEKMVEKMRKEYRRRWHEHTRVYPGVLEMLDRLDGCALPKAVLSNKPHHFVEQMVKKLLGTWSFAVVRGALPGIPLKPDPAAALEIARDLKIPPAEIILAGDSCVDMQTAESAGMYGAGVLWGFRDAGELLASGARTLLSHPRELFKLFKQLP